MQIDPDAPWWINVILTVLILAVIPALTWLGNRSTRRDVKEIKAQTNNSHETNLREDVDLAKDDARAAKESSHRTERHVVDLVKSVRAVEHSLDLRTDLHTKAIDELTDDTMPNVVAHALAAHVRYYHQEQKP